MSNAEISKIFFLIFFSIRHLVTLKFRPFDISTVDIFSFVIYFLDIQAFDIQNFRHYVILTFLSFKIWSF